MRSEILSYFEMCQREGTSLQRGMNFRSRGRTSIFLMSLRPNAPYRDRVEEDGTVLIYEGHDVPRTAENLNPKQEDQPEFQPSGTLTENGKFYRASKDYKLALRGPEKVQVYEKIRKGIWADNGHFHLIDAWNESDGVRQVFKFKLLAIDDEKTDVVGSESVEPERSRVIPTDVKLEVWKRDSGQCVICGATDELHFDHIVPFTKGGTSLMAENIQLLCARHNLEKRDKIQ